MQWSDNPAILKSNPEMKNLAANWTSRRERKQDLWGIRNHYAMLGVTQFLLSEVQCLVEQIQHGVWSLLNEHVTAWEPLEREHGTMARFREHGNLIEREHDMLDSDFRSSK